MGTPAGSIDWERLAGEFERFEPDEEICAMAAPAFVRSLIEPCPHFVHLLAGQKHPEASGRAEAMRALYAFLLQKRYEERLNLLYFAFTIFDEKTDLPQELIDRTPFHHEEGVPPFSLINDPDFEISVET